MDKEIAAIGGVGIALAAFIKYSVTEKLKKIELISQNQFKVDALKEQLTDLKKIMEEKLGLAQQVGAERHAEIKMFIQENRKMREEFIITKNQVATQWEKIDDITRSVKSIKGFGMTNEDL